MTPSRPTDSGAVDEATRAAVAGAVARRRAAVIDRYTVHDGEFAAVGVPAVAAALDRGQVDTLLLDPHAIDGVRIWVGLNLPRVAPSEAELRRWGATRVERVRADEALIRAAAATDAELILVSPEDVRLRGGAGAVLRYPDPTVTHP